MAREYRDSGIEWIGQIPKEWEVNKGKQLYISNDGGVWGEDATGTNDTIVLRSTEQDIDGRLSINEPAMRHLSEIERQNAMLKEGDLIITKSSGSPSHIGKTSIIGKDVASMDCCFSNFIQRIRIDGIPQYYWYVFNSFVVKNQFSYLSTTTTGINNINAKTLDQLQLLYPPLSEQQKIANYLDKVCGEVDEMVALQETMIEELKAYKQSVITEVVTKGLNPNVPMRESGIDWIGDLPEHWEQHQFRRIFEIKKIIAGTLGYDVLSVTQNGIKVKDLTKNEGQIAQDYSKYQLVDVDDYVMNHMDLLTGYVDCSKQNGVTSPDYRVFRAIDKSRISLAYYLRIFQTCYKEKIFYHLGQGVSGMGRWRLPAEQLKLFVLPMPPLSEQQQIASYLDTKCSEIDALIVLKQAKIEELKEYKKSVIYEYVTGKKEVV